MMVRYKRDGKENTLHAFCTQKYILHTKLLRICGFMFTCFAMMIWTEFYHWRNDSKVNISAEIWIEFETFIDILKPSQKIVLN